MTKFLESKPQVPSITISVLPAINILPSPKHLELSFGVSIDIPPVYPKLSIAHVHTTNVLYQTNSSPLLPTSPQSASSQPHPVEDQQLPLSQRPLSDLTRGQFSEIWEKFMNEKFKPP